ncbi:MAG: hypothetical protein QM754_15530 [Tepidisphaeraceae bacterium]
MNALSLNDASQRSRLTRSAEISMFRASVFSDVDCIPFLERLNQTDWFRHSLHPKPNSGRAIMNVISTLKNRREQKAAVRLANYAGLPKEAVGWGGGAILRLLSLMVAQGPEVFFPPFALCEYFENVDVRLPLVDYAQSYPVVTVCFPHDYATSRGLDFNYVATLLESQPSFLTILTSNVLARNQSFSFVSESSPSIEHSISRTMLHGDAVPDARIDAALRLAARVAINANLYLVDKGYRVKHLLDARTRRRRAARASREGRLLLPPQELLLTQDVVVETVRSEPDASGSLDVLHHKQSHYRRGHWRMQPIGPGRSERKKIFIRPVLVNARFAPAGTTERTVIYRGRADDGEER